jgi:colanic acid/amylovoran biosynthesis glycosyltransferase
MLLCIGICRIMKPWISSNALPFYVQHSQTTANGWVEGWGVSMAEASGAGLPVIATRHGGIVDHQIDGVTGYLVEEGDWQAMARRMKELAESPKLRAELGANGRAHIHKVGNLDIQLRKLVNTLFPEEEV